MMKKRLFSSLALGSLLALGAQASAQVVPDLAPVVQTITDRQVERTQNEAVERALEQAQAAAQNQALQRAEAQQAENVQSQALEQVQSQVERAQAQAAEQAQTQIERVQNQVERAQGQIDQVQSQVVDRTQSQMERVPDQAAERFQDRASELVPGIAGQTGAAGDAASNTVTRAVPDDLATQTPEPLRQIVETVAGDEAFVDITLGPGIRAVEFEWVMLVTPEQRQQLDDEAAELLNFLTDTEPFALAAGELLTFRVPPDLDADDAILELVPENLRDLIDRNHIYDVQNEDEGGTTAATHTSALLRMPMEAVCATPLTVGMIDSTIDIAHAAFADARATRIHNRSFVDTTLAQPASHGTAVAGMLVGKDATMPSATSLRPLLPSATLYNAAVFHEQEGVQEGATVMRMLAALDWLAAQDEIQVINMSLAGPPNRLLARAVTAVSAQGKVIVAAVGNEGPYAPQRYPAAYDEVVGVTAVERDSGIFRFANQGPYIDYAALGVQVPTARADGSFGAESGTSLAAPVVSAFLACAMAEHGDLASALVAMDKQVVDLGAKGRDPVYGNGLLHP